MSEPIQSARIHSAWHVVLLGAMAGGLGWGIRGQYGHETGAMIAGLLLSAVLVVRLFPEMPMHRAVRAMAMATVAIGIGGSMTYGQTVGLTHDSELVGHWGALRWGMLGLAIKGGIWIGFFGLFLGAGLGGVRYRTTEMVGLFVGFTGLYFLGVWVFNRPFDPANHVLPKLYFSDDWRWEPGATLKPRRECWGGLFSALLGGWFYMGWVKHDILARRLALWGVLGGMIGFPLGQSLQAAHAWNRAFFQQPPWAAWDSVMNWWNWMETTFGAVMGGFLGWGLWVNRRDIANLKLREVSPEVTGAAVNPCLEWGCIGVHVVLLITGEFTSVRWLNALYDPGLALAFLPMVGLVSGRWWPYLMVLPITLIPIAGKTIRALVYDQATVPVIFGWVLYGVLPIVGSLLLALGLGKRAETGWTARALAKPVLLFAGWCYFGLNYAFFRFPWPWETWTARTPNSLVFALCLAVLSWAALTPATENPIGRADASVPPKS